jgi:hypothetical protein
MTRYQDLEQQSSLLPGEGQGDLRGTIIGSPIESMVSDAGDGSEIDRKRTVQ